MKNPKKPTFDQKKRIAKAKLDPKAYLVISDADTSLKVVDKVSGQVLIVEGKTFRSVE